MTAAIEADGCLRAERSDADATGLPGRTRYLAVPAGYRYRRVAATSRFHGSPSPDEADDTARLQALVDAAWEADRRVPVAGRIRVPWLALEHQPGERVPGVLGRQLNLAIEETGYQTDPVVRRSVTRWPPRSRPNWNWNEAAVMSTERLKAYQIGPALDLADERGVEAARPETAGPRSAPATRRTGCCGASAGAAPADPPDERYYADEVRPAGVDTGGHMAWELVPDGLRRSSSTTCRRPARVRTSSRRAPSSGSKSGSTAAARPRWCTWRA